MIDKHNPVTNDNLMLVMIRDDEDKGVHIGWSPDWLNRCKADPKMMLATMNALGLALETFSQLVVQDVAIVEPPTTVN